MAIEWGNNLQPIKVYHSSNVDFETPDISKAKEGSNYGKGFYTTTKVDKKQGYGDIDYEYDLDASGLGDLTDYDFSKEQLDNLYNLTKGRNNYTQDEINDFFGKDFKVSNNGKRDSLLRFRMGLLGRMANNMNISVNDLLDKMGVGKFSSIKIPQNDDTNYYVVFDPNKLKFVKKVKK